MKQLIILSIVLPIHIKSDVKTKEKLEIFKGMLYKTFDEKLQEETNTIIKWIIILGKENDTTKIECIYPKEPISSDLLEKIKTIENDTVTTKNQISI